MSGSVWKKPEDVMRQMREKKRALQARFSHTATSTHISTNSPLSTEKELTSDSPSGAVKRKNPFRRSPVKKISRLQSEDAEPPSFISEDTNDNTLFKILGSSTKSKESYNTDGHIPTPPTVPQILEPSKTTEGCILKHCVADWSLKTRVRFTSKTPFAFSSTLKTSEEASGITGFVRCVNSSCSEAWSSLDTSTNAQFHACCLYWQHPFLPWLSTFPRDTQAPVTSSSLTVNVGIDPKICNSLLNDWCESFRSLFGLLRARQCPFFYVCTHQFMVLFRAAGIGGVAETHALVTPTTKGLREVIQAEDIAFTMPLRKSNQQTGESANQSSLADQCTGVEDDYNGVDDDEEDVDELMSGIDLHANLRSKLEAERLQDGGQGTTQGSYSDSLLLIEGVDTQGLFNWLMTSKLCISNTGPLSGVPPTLLAPNAFHGATLRPLKVRQGLLKQDGENVYSIEVQGPVMPHSVVSLMHLLAQSGDYSAIFSVLASSKPYSIFSNNVNQHSSINSSALFGKESLSDCGLDPRSLDIFCSPQTAPPFNEIHFKSGCFHLSN